MNTLKYFRKHCCYSCVHLIFRLPISIHHSVWSILSLPVCANGSSNRAVHGARLLQPHGLPGLLRAASAQGAASEHHHGSMRRRSGLVVSTAGTSDEPSLVLQRDILQAVAFAIPGVNL